MTSENVVRILQGVQYDGTNSADVLALYPLVGGFETSSYFEASIASEVDGVLVIHYDDTGNGLTVPYNGEINIGDWVTPQPNFVCEILPAAGLARLDTLTNP